MSSTHLTIFQNKQIRRHRDEHAEKRYFSVVDIISIASGSDRPRKYRSDLKANLIKEWTQVSEKIGQLKMQAPDGKYYKTDVADVETMGKIFDDGVEELE